MAAVVLVVAMLAAIGAEAATDWRVAYRDHLARYYKLSRYFYLGLIDIGRDGTPELLYIAQDSHYRYPALKIVGFVGGKAKVISTRKFQREMMGFDIAIYRYNGAYMCVMDANYWSKTYNYQSVMKLTSRSSKQVSYKSLFGWSEKLRSRKPTIKYTIGGRRVSESKYNAYYDQFYANWNTCHDGLARSTGWSDMDEFLADYKREAYAYSMPY